MGRRESKVTSKKTQSQPEIDMIKVWSRYLNRPEKSFGIDENFFQLGGDYRSAAAIEHELTQPPYDYHVTVPMILRLANIRDILREMEAIKPSKEASLEMEVLKGRENVDIAESQRWVVSLEMGFEAINGLTADYFFIPMPTGIDFKQATNAVNYVIRRHEAFRITMKRNNFVVRQSCVPMKRIEVPEFYYKSSEQVVEHARKLASTIAKVIDGGLLWNFNFIQLPGQRFIILAISQLIMDVVSFELIRDEFRILFEAYSRKQQPNLPELKAGLLDYILWETRHVQRNFKRVAKAEEFWVSRLKGFTGPALLKSQSILECIGHPSRYYCLQFDEKCTNYIDKLVQESRTTLHSFTMAAVMVILHRYTGQRDMTIINATNIRYHPWAHQIIGQFVRLSLSRTRWSDDPSFGQLLAQIHLNDIEEYEHKFYPHHMIMDQISDEMIQNVPVSLGQGVDQPEPNNSITGINSLPYSLNALVIHFKRVERHYAIELNFAINAFEEPYCFEFAEKLKQIVLRVAKNPNLPLTEYCDAPKPPQVVTRSVVRVVPTESRALA